MGDASFAVGRRDEAETNRRPWKGAAQMASNHGGDHGGDGPRPGESAPKIQHSPAQFSATPPAGDEPLPVADSGGVVGSSKIRTFGKERRHEDEWSRTPNATGKGAIHVKTFHAKLTDDALRYMDQTINEWLDAHPQYEVKFVNSSVGVLTGKLKEPHLICQVWV